MEIEDQKMGGEMDDPKKYFTYLFFQLRDRQETSQVLFVFPSEKGRGRELRPSENTKPFYEI